MREWTTFTPDGRWLVVQHEDAVWSAKCGDADGARNALLDVALVEAVRNDGDVAAHAPPVNYASWARTLADQIQGELASDG